MMADLDGTVRGSSVNIAPVYDNSPYFNQPNRIGQFRFRNMKIKGMAEKIVRSALVYSNSIYLSILVLSLLCSRSSSSTCPSGGGRREPGPKPLILYFFFIGLAFILVEIIFIKIFQLFLGSPAISISIIIFSLLVSSGIGSLFSDAPRPPVGPAHDPCLRGPSGRRCSRLYGFGLFPLLNGLMFLAFALAHRGFLPADLAGRLLHGLLFPGRHPAAGSGRTRP